LGAEEIPNEPAGKLIVNSNGEAVSFITRVQNIPNP
jgi:hypothetical protein